MPNFLDPIKKYAQFGGRARRKEYWYFFLLITCISFLIGIFEPSGPSVLLSIIQFSMVIPSIAVGVRRMHDVNRSGWYLFIPIYNILLLAEDGSPGKNRYGDDPKSKSDSPTIENPDLTWNCPECNFTNSNTSFQCSSCKYQL